MNKRKEYGDDWFRDEIADPMLLAAVRDVKPGSILRRINSCALSVRARLRTSSSFNAAGTRSTRSAASAGMRTRGSGSSRSR